MQMLSDQYIAGFFDGEGYIGIQRNTKNGTHVLVSSFTQAHPGILRKIQKVFGGVITPRNAIHGAFALWMRAKESKVLLERMLPYLVVKYEEAVVALRFLSHKREHNLITTQDSAYKDGVRLERAWFDRKLKSIRANRMKEARNLRELTLAERSI